MSTSTVIAYVVPSIISNSDISNSLRKLIRLVQARRSMNSDILIRQSEIAQEQEDANRQTIGGAYDEKTTSNTTILVDKQSAVRAQSEQVVDVNMVQSSTDKAVQRDVHERMCMETNGNAAVGRPTHANYMAGGKTTMDSVDTYNRKVDTVESPPPSRCISGLVFQGGGFALQHMGYSRKHKGMRLKDEFRHLYTRELESLKSYKPCVASRVDLKSAQENANFAINPGSRKHLRKLAQIAKLSKNNKSTFRVIDYPYTVSTKFKSRL